MLPWYVLLILLNATDIILADCSNCSNPVNLQAIVIADRMGYQLWFIDDKSSFLLGNSRRSNLQRSLKFFAVRIITSRCRSLHPTVDPIAAFPMKGLMVNSFKVERSHFESRAVPRIFSLTSPRILKGKPFSQKVPNEPIAIEVSKKPK